MTSKRGLDFCFFTNVGVIIESSFAIRSWSYGKDYIVERSYRFIQNSHIKAKNRNPHLFFIFEFISLNVESFTVELVSYTRAREFLLNLLLDNTNLGGI